jgi:hypothetical protein
MGAAETCPGVWLAVTSISFDCGRAIAPEGEELDAGASATPD